MATRQGKILIVDDNEDILFTLKMLLRPRVESITTCSDPKEINRLVSRNQYDVVLLDMNFTADAVSGKEGFYWLERILEISPGTVVILITAYSDTEKAVRAIKAGATDFIPKPWQNEKMLATVSTALELSLSRSEVRTLKEQKSALTASEPEIEIIGESAAMQNVFRTLEKLKDTDANILLQGENGTGKDLIAYTLHQQSVRGKEPFVPIDLGSIPHELFESELFGHEKGAFTDARESRPGKFEAASGSTLFLDEIGNLPVGLQAKLLAALQNREVTRLGSNRKIPIDIRLIAATNRDLPELVKQSLFREDLYYRINTIQIEIPPLRNRREDIPLFIDYFLKKYTALYNQPGLTIHPQAAAKLERYNWPGNIRELQHTIEKAVILAEKNVIRAADLFIRPGKSVSFSDTPNLGEVERKTIEAAITQNDGNLTAAAEQLGVSRQTLYNKLKRFNL